MTLGFIETRMFMQIREEYFDGDASYSALQQVLLSDPLAGPVMRGCGGLRKIRWPDPRRGKGKRGGLRIIYFYVPEAQMILFVKVYDKDEADNLTAYERKLLTALAEDLRKTTLKRR
jgi:mRNA-degrading endonuclease RelE of RelBE toxin-antitoxin system